MQWAQKLDSTSDILCGKEIWYYNRLKRRIDQEHSSCFSLCSLMFITFFLLYIMFDPFKYQDELSTCFWQLSVAIAGEQANQFLGTDTYSIHALGWQSLSRRSQSLNFWTTNYGHPNCGRTGWSWLDTP